MVWGIGNTLDVSWSIFLAHSYFWDWVFCMFWGFQKSDRTCYRMLAGAVYIFLWNTGNSDLLAQLLCLVLEQTPPHGSCDKGFLRNHKAISLHLNPDVAGLTINIFYLGGNVGPCWTLKQELAQKGILWWRLACQMKPLVKPTDWIPGPSALYPWIINHLSPFYSQTTVSRKCIKIGYKHYFRRLTLKALV